MTTEQEQAVEFRAPAASRAYYAMFYLAEAFLLGKRLRFHKHSAVIAAFGQHLSATRQVPPRFHRTIIDAEEVRRTADYNLLRLVTPEQASELIAQAQEFLRFAEQRL